VAAGTPAVAQEPAWTVIATLPLARTDTRTVEIPLGLWPLRPKFQLALQVSCVTNNWYDAVIFDDAALVPARPRPRLGVNETNLAWDPGGIPAMEARVDQMAQLGIRQLRLGLRGTSLLAETVAIVKRARGHGMGVLLAVVTDAEDFVDPAGALAHAGSAFNAKCGWPSGIYRLTAVDLGRYKARLQSYVSAFAAAGLVIDAYEIGNEYDWVCFNGDLPLSGTITPTDFDATVQAYAGILKASHQVLHDPARCANPLVLTFGASNGYFTLGGGSGSVDATAFLARLRSIQGADYLASFADGIAEHLYNNDEHDAAILEAAATVVPAGRPFWITEWGVATSVVATGYPRYAALKQELTRFNSLPALSVENSFLYAFSDGVWEVFDPPTGTPLYEARIFQDYPVTW
jgi:hypothetical protein